MSVVIRRASARFVTRAPGRDSRHAFSFGQHYDPGNVGFGPMVCHDEHRLSAGTGFPDHPHQDLEIVTWVLSGTLTHAHAPTSRSAPDPAPGGLPGPPVAVPAGTVQVLSAGSGVRHEETADPAGGPVHLVQAWLRPDAPGGEPSYAAAEVPLPVGELVLVASGHLPQAPARIGTSSATFRVARLETGQTLTLPAEADQHVFVARGALTRSSLAEPLAAGDAFLITGRPGLEVTAAVPTELLVWTFTS